MELDKLRQEVDTFLQSMGYSLYDLEFVNEEGNNVLRIFIDKTEDINMDDIVEVSKAINPWIDELDPIEDAYMLEVSSPGAERELRTKEAIQHAINRYVYVETFNQNIEGDLIDFKDDVVTINVKNKQHSFNLIDINKIRLAIDFRRRKND